MRCVGALIAWLAAAVRIRKLSDSQLRDAEKRAATAESSTAELRQQVATTSGEIADLRTSLPAEQTAKASAEAAWQAERRNLQEQRVLLNEAKAKLSDVFKALSTDVLGQQSERFLALAKEKFGTLRAEADGDLAKREEAIKTLVAPLENALVRYESEIKQIESNRQRAYGDLDGHLTKLTEANKQLQQQTAKLVTALRKPQVRGRWGEITLLT